MGWRGAVLVHGNGTRITVWPSRGYRITGPLPCKRRTETAHGNAEEEEKEDAEEEEHIMEDMMASINDDNVSVSFAAADTAGESAFDDGSSSDAKRTWRPCAAGALACLAGIMFGQVCEHVPPED